VISECVNVEDDVRVAASAAAAELFGDVDVPGPAQRWWVVHTRARHEKTVAGQLERLRIAYFLPLVEARRSYGGRAPRTVRLPLFPGYLFLRGESNERAATLRTHRVAQVIEVADQERLRHELRQIHRAVNSGVPMDLYPGIQRGRRCRVTSGSLRGMEGTVLRRRGLCRVYLAVQILGQSAEVEIDPGLLEVIE